MKIIFETKAISKFWLMKRFGFEYFAEQYNWSENSILTLFLEQLCCSTVACLQAAKVNCMETFC